MQSEHTTLARWVVALLFVNLIIGMLAAAYTFLGLAFTGLYQEGLRSDFAKFDYPGIINTDLMNEHFGVESLAEWWHSEPQSILLQLHDRVWLGFLAFGSIVALNVLICAILLWSLRRLIKEDLHWGREKLASESTPKYTP